MFKRPGKIIKIFAACFLFLAVGYLLFAPVFVFAQNEPGGTEPGATGPGGSVPGGGLRTGFVPCGNIKNAQGVIQNPCETCHIFVLGQNIINFLWWSISIPIATLALIYAGFLMIIPGASSARLEKGKKVLTNTLIGIAIVFFAWLGIDTIIKLLAGQNLTSGAPANIQGYGPWNRIECQIRGLPAPVDTGRTTPTPSPGGVYTAPPLNRADPVLVQAILQDRLINFDTSADCGGSNHARGTVDAILNGQLPPVCSPDCRTTGCRPGGAGGNVTLSNNMLVTLDAVSRAGLRFKVTSFTTGIHNENSAHYQGRAADLVPEVRTTFAQLEARLKTSQNIAQDRLGNQRVFCEDDSGNVISCRLPLVNHLHAEFR